MVKQHSRRRGRQEGLRDGGSLGLAASGRGIWEVHLRGGGGRGEGEARSRRRWRIRRGRLARSTEEREFGQGNDHPAPHGSGKERGRVAVGLLGRVVGYGLERK